ncbi:hypothetical protein GP486_003941 [Trichoglossum hirsutum]|uniref:HAUS augmin-like complex subunit 6 N-terminal domain-containing protein n=1 Tax=Trichoglossum hirsutum TaxID=265104 RepID=A0A9P8LC21_9PEZI|nr:hypothetical protein GP486_003941 [Trichoglossum hirsutum]
MPATATLAAPSAPPANAKAPLPVKPHGPRSIGCPSNVSLFLTSLRLLDLDKHPEWPGISRHTFSYKDAQQGQKNRIKCVEWALYHLFEIWDGEGTRNKLQPFFPPLEPLQSINLRAALFRCLSELKKDGVLGRDMVLRKTMLDECKGERFEELLAVFASVVLKKRFLHEDASSAGIGWHLATATSLTMEEQSLLRPLVIAHRASLTNCLREREEAKGRYEDFASLLELKRRQVVRREEELNHSIEEQRGESIISGEEGKTLRQQWQENWVGDEKLLDIVVDGDARPGVDELLSERYGLIWEKVEDGKLSEVEDAREKTLLEELDGRVRDQKLRLERWKTFRAEFDKRADEGKTTKSEIPGNSVKKKHGFNLNFGGHKELIPGARSPFKFIPDAKTQGPGEMTRDEGLDHEYARLMKSMQVELAKVGRSRRSGGLGWRRNKKANTVDFNTRVEENEDVSEVSPMVEGSTRQGAEEPSMEEVGFEKTAECVGQPSQPSEVNPAHVASSDEESLDGRAAVVAARPKPVPDGSAPIMPEPDPSLPHPEHPPRRLKDARLSLLDPEGQELLAEQRGSSAEDSSLEDPAISLVERTRKSMSTFQQAASTKPVTQAARPRKSIHQPPKLPQARHAPHLETPDRHDDLYGSDNSIPREELFSPEADYASVFKSRPKIALSPTFSPTAPGEDRELELPGFESSVIEVEDWEGGVEESPSLLVRAREKERRWRGLGK